MINLLLCYILSYYFNLLYYLFAASISFLKTSPNEIIKFLLYYFFDLFHFGSILCLNYFNFVFIYLFYYFSIQFIFVFIFNVIIYYYFCYYYYSYLSDFFLAKYFKGKTSISEEIYIQNWFLFLAERKIINFRRRGVIILEEDDLNNFEDAKYIFLRKPKKDKMRIYFQTRELQKNRKEIMSLSRQQRFLLPEKRFLETRRLEHAYDESKKNQLILLSQIFKKRSQFYRYGFYIYYLFRFKEAIFAGMQADKKEKKLKEKYGALYNNELKNKNDHKPANIIRIKTSTEIDFLAVQPIINEKIEQETITTINNIIKNNIEEDKTQNSEINQNLKKS